MEMNSLVTDKKLLILAREIAMDILPLETILETNQIDQNEFESIKSSPHFQRLLQDAVVVWGSAMNTQERVKLKAAASIEELLPEFHARMHDRSETLMAKVKAAELVAKLAGMSQNAPDTKGGGEKFTVTINLGRGSEPIVIEQTTPMGNVLDYEGDEE